MPGAASGVHDVLLLLLLLLLPLFCRCPGGAAAMYVLLLCCSAVVTAAAAMAAIFFAADPRDHGYYARQPLSVMCLGNFKLKDGSISFGRCTSTVSQLTFIWRLGGGLVPAYCSFRMIRTCTLCCC